MLHTLFSDVSIEQQETVVGGYSVPLYQTILPLKEYLINDILPLLKRFKMIDE
jgi:hypothetical protein